ncbi:hypothetical protein Bpfe_025025 [Biomphalaria pfeifferi]|uniref:Uncharacterized protein n=1 Tax=Biomphalaria pfeifferi TaxID=112525 RepID=A0AAD8B009_BIOPF|nr:hypothetical protein Bpfe_025025 [Biomphalaria pfeifferi]
MSSIRLEIHLQESGGMGSHGSNCGAGLSKPNPSVPFRHFKPASSGPRGRGHVGQPQGHRQERHGSRHLDGRTFSDAPPSYQSVMSDDQKKYSIKKKAGANGHFANTAQGRPKQTHFRRGQGTTGHNQNQRQAPRNRHFNAVDKESQGNRSIPFEQLKALSPDTSSINIRFTSMNISATCCSDSRKYTEQTGRGRGQPGRGRGQPGRGRGQPGRGRGQPGRGRGQPGRGRGQPGRGRGQPGRGRGQPGRGRGQAEKGRGRGSRC